MKSLTAVTDNTRDIDVLLINPGSLHAVYQELGRGLSAIETPTLAALFATYCRGKELSVDLLDAPAFDLGAEAVAEWVTSNINPALVVLVVYGFQPSASTQNMPAAGMICKELKKRNPDIRIMMTGTHPAALPERTLREEHVDYVCSGEGPETIVGVARMLKTASKVMHDIPDLVYWHADTVMRTEPGELIRNLDEVMPEPAFDLLPMEKYRAHNWHCFDHINERQPYASLYTTLGCPYKCSFCCINAPFGKPSYRMWSADTVIGWIDKLVNEYGIKNIKFIDEMFVLNRNHVLEISNKLIERNYDLNIWAYARVDTVKDEYLEKLRLAGFRWLALGIESASKHVRDGVEKGRFREQEILDVVRRIQDAGIYVIGNYIFGLPDDTNKSMEATLQLALEANCEFSNFYSAMAYPGSRLYDQALINNWTLPESWIGYSQHSYECHPLPTETLTSAEVLAFRDKAFKRFYSSSRYLNMVLAKFGQDVVDHIGEFNSISLKRKLLET